MSAGIEAPAVRIRPLEVRDALTSYRWRNDPEVWRHTASQPDRRITPEIETEWLRRALHAADAQRFAICVGEPGGEAYVGNIQLTDIDGESAQYHVFVGDRAHWGRGVATRATAAILRHAFDVLHLERVWLTVARANTPAVQLYRRAGFEEQPPPAGVSLDPGFLYMALQRRDYIGNRGG
jgi:RimJ/RimL family protein N-acetyltransferase